MSRVRIGAPAVALLAAVALLWFLPGMDVDETFDTRPGQLASEERLRLLKGISDGQVLYLRSVRYDKRNPASLGMLWTPPEHTIEETWMAEDDDGAFTTYTTVTRDTGGEVVSHSRLVDGQSVATWAATGDTVAEPLSDEGSCRGGWWASGTPRRVWRTRVMSWWARAVGTDSQPPSMRVRPPTQ